MTIPNCREWGGEADTSLPVAEGWREGGKKAGRKGGREGGRRGREEGEGGRRGRREGGRRGKGRQRGRETERDEISSCIGIYCVVPHCKSLQIAGFPQGAGGKEREPRRSAANCYRPLAYVFPITPIC